DSNAEKDFNPPFMFELKCDNTSVSSNNNMSPFECVYDFCSSLENFCKSKAAINNRWDIEKDWHKLLLACSSHNYERFMWIHLTFQADKNVKLGWKQVVRRLMTRFDDPQRIISLRSILTNFRYQP
ncbi:uncharacterized protein BX663DRAFT_409803, partial [Cokeromyces recurvatus]|uniref:uncharacterized protein n=1 Tax=Cokeromyces recurvatus TaxID=90255 RepID=UPI002221223A